MGQKVNPIGLRVGINRTWESRWFAKGDEYADLLHEDLRFATSSKRNSRTRLCRASSSSARTRNAASPSTRLVRVW
jgi:ribosomal protein S3